jgi:hypothetical protein
VHPGQQGATDALQLTDRHRVEVGEHEPAQGRRSGPTSPSVAEHRPVLGAAGRGARRRPRPAALHGSGGQRAGGTHRASTVSGEDPTVRRRDGRSADLEPAHERGGRLRVGQLVVHDPGRRGRADSGPVGTGVGSDYCTDRLTRRTFDRASAAAPRGLVRPAGWPPSPRGSPSSPPPRSCRCRRRRGVPAVRSCLAVPPDGSEPAPAIARGGRRPRPDALLDASSSEAAPSSDHGPGAQPRRIGVAVTVACAGHGSSRAPTPEPSGLEPLAL